jgi:hypothetical protein
MRIIESTDRSITFEIVPGYHPVQTIVSGNERYDLLTFSRSAVDESKPGMPDVRFMTVPLALPGRRGCYQRCARTRWRRRRATVPAQPNFLCGPNLTAKPAKTSR